MIGGKEQKSPEVLNEEIEKKKIESRKHSLKDAASVSATVGFGNNYITAYGIALGATPTQIGLLNSLPAFLGSLAQLFTSKVMEVASRKKILSISTLYQSLFWIPIVLISLLYLKGITYAPVLLVVFYIFYSIFGNFAHPAWSSWMGDLVDSKKLGRFFGKRNSIGNVCALASVILGGIILDYFQKQTETRGEIFIFLGFSLIFLLAMIFRLISRYFVLKQYEPEFRFQKSYYFSFKSFIKEALKRDFGSFAVFVAFFVFAANIVAPFYAIYMLKDLNFSYFQFMIIIVSGALASILFMPLWGRFIDEYGNIHTLKTTSLMIPLICFLWPLSTVFALPLKFYFLILTNFFGGFAWAGFNLAAGNFLYEAVSPQRRSLCVAYSSILSGIGLVLGASLGGLLISRIEFTMINIIMLVSIISGILRYIVVFVFTPKLIEVRIIKTKPKWREIPLFNEVLSASNYIHNTFMVKMRSIRINKEGTIDKPDNFIHKLDGFIKKRPLDKKK